MLGTEELGSGSRRDRSMQSSESRLFCTESLGDPRLAMVDPVFFDDERILENLLKLEERYQPSSNSYTIQTEVRDEHRETLAEWMYEVCEAENCDPNVFLVALNYINRLLCLEQLKRTRLQLVASSCLLIASKIRQSTPLATSTIIYYTDRSITTTELLDQELVTLLQLRWETAGVTPCDFLHQIVARLSLVNDPTKLDNIRRQAETFILICVHKAKYSQCPPSLLATACVRAAVLDIMGVQWCRKRHFDNKLNEIIPTDFDWLEEIHQQIEGTLIEHISTRHPDSRLPSEDLRNCNSPATTPTDILSITVVD